MVMRYFGSKTSVFTAAATTNLVAPDLQPVLPGKRGEFIVRHFVERWERSPGDDTLVFLLRTAVTNDAVAGQLQARFDDLITKPLAALGLDGAQRRGSLIGTQLLGLALCRYVLHLEPIGSADVQDLIADLAPAVQLHLDAEPDQMEDGPSRDGLSASTGCDQRAGFTSGKAAAAVLTLKTSS